MPERSGGAGMPRTITEGSRIIYFTEPYVVETEVISDLPPWRYGRWRAPRRMSWA